jgi:hypothetical protein
MAKNLVAGNPLGYKGYIPEVRFFFCFFTKGIPINVWIMKLRISTFKKNGKLRWH